MASFTYLFNYPRDLEKGKLFGGFKNPVYRCYKGFWSTCEARAPATLEGAVVYRFECGWEFFEKCLKYHIITGRSNAHSINGAHFDSLS
ncbi:hypothetical protein M5K25_013677 [Dendrobium thyrsiflorum]|uniref:Uncharacterized protein n=1 Tax=Dendrobium thyrsiflorum TaxID=117978 RepID=A0ABD0UTX6_DENTH